MNPLETLVAEHPTATAIAIIGIILCLIALRDILQRRHAITHNFPIVGHLRYFFETIGPELDNIFSPMTWRSHSTGPTRWFMRHLKENNTFGFGTSELIYELGYPILKHSTFPISPELNPEDPTAIACLKIVGEANKRRHAFQPSSIINISDVLWFARSPRNRSAQPGFRQMSTQYR